MSSASRRTHFVYNLAVATAPEHVLMTSRLFASPAGIQSVFCCLLYVNRAFTALVVQHFGTLTTAMRFV